jgi:hypothetical protein
LADSATKLVLHICANESPEGNLPASFHEMQMKMTEVINDASDLVSDMDISTCSQLLLHQCFRTIKESTAVLATISEIIPISPSEESSSVSISLNWIGKAGEMLCKLLLAV